MFQSYEEVQEAMVRTTNSPEAGPNLCRLGYHREEKQLETCSRLFRHAFETSTELRKAEGIKFTLKSTSRARPFRQRNNDR
jgi:hypothetical protein